jgi:hypothetical protein
VLVDGSEGVPEVVFGDLAAEDDAGDAREVVVQPCPQSGADDLVAEVVGVSKCRTAFRFPAGPTGSNP